MDFDEVTGGVQGKYIALGAVVAVAIVLIIVAVFMLSGNSSTANTNVAGANVGPVGGQSVYVERVSPSGSDADCLHIAGIKILDAAGQSLMSNPVLSMGSVFRSDAQYSVNNIVDGNNATFAHTECADMSKEWIKVDLGSNKHIKTIIVVNRTDCCQARIVGCRVRVVNSAGANVYVSDPISTVSAEYTFQANL